MFDLTCPTRQECGPLCVCPAQRLQGEEGASHSLLESTCTWADWSSKLGSPGETHRDASPGRVDVGVFQWCMCFVRVSPMDTVSRDEYPGECMCVCVYVCVSPLTSNLRGPPARDLAAPPLL